MIINLLAFLLVLGILVMVHEFGHFVAARLNGVRVDKFAFGFPPKIWSKKIGETEYTLNLIPFGGYVAMYGEEGGHNDDPKSFTSKRAWRKGTILAAGVLMNLVLAWAILTAFYLFGGKALISGMDNIKGVANNQKVYITQVVAKSPAAQNGLKPGDIIVSVNGDIVHDQNVVFADIQQAKIDHPTQPIAIKVERNGKTSAIGIDTYKETVSGEEVQRIGITMEEKGKTQAKWYLAPWVAFVETGRIIRLTIVGIWGILVSIFTRFSVGEGVGGPVAIYSYSGIFARLGFWALAQFIVILSISLALINILPFPALDGGHLAILTIEGVTRKKIPDSTKQAVNNIGFAILLLMMVALVFRDLANLGVFVKVKGIFK